MNKLLKNLLNIHEKISDVKSFINIKVNIENLNENDGNYKKLVDQTDLLIQILTIFSESPKTIGEWRKANE